MSYSYDRYDRNPPRQEESSAEKALRGKLGFLWIFLALTLAFVVVCVVFWLIIWIFPAIGGTGAVYLRDSLGMLKGTLFPGGWPTPFFWILISIIAGVSLVLWSYIHENGRPIIAWILSVLMVLGAVAFGIAKGSTSGILASDYYLTTTALQVKDTDVLPAMLQKYVNDGSLEVTLEEGDLTSSWVPRVASMTGAMKVLSKTSGAVNNTELMRNTVTYLYGEGVSGAWTAIRNSLGQQDIYGISSWNGTGDENRINTCRFTGDNALKKNFGGAWGKSLWNSIAAKYPSFYYNESDMWGYCDGTEPIIVLPGVILSHFDVQLTDRKSVV